MAESNGAISFKVQKQILKFEEGVDPATGTPIEIVTQTETITGEAAKVLYDQMQLLQNKKEG